MADRTHRIASIPGDGIGKEVVPEALRVLEAAGKRFGFEVTVDGFDFACAEYHEAHGRMMPEDWKETLRSYDAILFGAVGWPDKVPDHVSLWGSLVQFRRQFDQYVSLRPVRLMPGVRSPLADPGAIDFVIVRENTEGLFASFDGGAEIADQVVGDTMLVSRRGTERIARHAFALARNRSGRPLDGRPLVTCVDKANIFRSLAFFRRVFTEVATREFPEVAHGHALVDALSLAVLQDPASYDVLVMENMFGDILSDLATALCGGLGMAPSGDIGDAHGMFQPSHGSAPTIAGRGIANPSATILSAGMMLDWLGSKNNDPDAVQGAKLIDEAVGEVTTSGTLTADLGGTASTSEMGDAVIQAVSRSVRAGRP